MPDTKAKIALELNGEPVEVAFAPHKTLLEVLREDLGLTGTKHGCELGECGTCAVLVDGTIRYQACFAGRCDVPVELHPPVTLVVAPRPKLGPALR